MKITSLSDAEIVLKDFMPNVQTTNWTFSLERMQAFMEALGNPQEKVKIIHVAGTSGKTSTAYYITEMLQRAGKKVGLTVSPHVDSINERIQLDGQPMDEGEFCSLLGEFIDLPVVKEADPSYFGLVIGFAFWVFAKENVDYAVIEVGLGGRLDSTNVIHRPDKLCVITDIGLDHVVMLGDTVEQIASEKAGIIQASNHAIMARQAPEIEAVIKGRADTAGATLEVLDFVPDSAPAKLPLFQQRNWSVARAAVSYVAQRDAFEFNDQMALQSAELLIPARMETVHHKGKTVIIDGAHNAQKFEALCKSIQEKYPNQRLAAVVSITHGKDESATKKMAALKLVVDALIITTFRSDQDAPKWSVDPEIIKRAAEKVGFTDLQIIDNPKEAFEALMKRPEEVVMVTGSFYLLNHIRPLLKDQV